MKRYLHHLIAEKIEELISKEEYSSDGKLPTVEEMSKKFGVSKRVISNAIQLLEERDLIYKSRKKGIYVQEVLKKQVSTLSDNKGQPDVSRTMEIAERIRLDIIQGKYKAGDYLPQQKSLMLELRASRSILIKALRILEGKKLVKKYGRNYSVDLPEVRTRKPNSQIYYYGDLQRYSMYMYSPWNEFFLSFETEIVKKGLVSFRQFSSKNDINSIPSSEAIFPLGIVYYGNSLGSGVSQQELNLLSRRRIPVAMFDVMDYYREIKIPSNVAVFYNDNIRAGREIAKYTAMLGHRKIAFLSASMSFLWSEERFTGLKEELTNIYGNDFELNSCGLQQIHESDPCVFFAGLQDITPDEMAKLIPSRYIKGHRFKRVNPFTVKPFRSTIGKSPIPEGGIALWRSYRKDLIYSGLYEHFERLIRTKEITCWICSDQIATAVAFEFLQERNIKVPEQISLIGIDDDMDCFVYGITTYNFCIHRMGYLAAHYLLGDIPVKADNKGGIDCPGTIIVRETSAPVKKVRL